MAEILYHPDDPIVAAATPMAMSALTLIRTSGAGTIERISRIFSRPDTLKESTGHRAIYGSILDESKAKVDEVVLVVFLAPHSFTGEESVEITAHGSPPGIRTIIDLLIRAGFRTASPGEFTLRAFLNGKIDLTKAEAIRELVESKTNAAHRLALNRLDGNLSRCFDFVRGELLDLISPVELALDYPSEETGEELEPGFDVGRTESLIDLLDGLINGHKTGRIYQDGLSVVIAGATNSGKSSLFNAIVRQDRAIVSPEHGTTRDYIESLVDVRGVPVKLFDSAGIRSETDYVEHEGINRTYSLISASDCVVYLVDGATGISENDLRVLETIDEARLIKVYSKSDITSGRPPDGFLSASAVTKDGLTALEDRIVDMFGITEMNGSTLLIESDHQRRALDECKAALQRAIKASIDAEPLDLVAAELGDARRAIAELVGEITRDDILESIFSKFCVGK